MAGTPGFEVDLMILFPTLQLLTLGTMTRPLLVCLGLMPRALFAGELRVYAAHLDAAFSSFLPFFMIKQVSSWSWAGAQ